MKHKKLWILIFSLTFLVQLITVILLVTGFNTKYCVLGLSLILFAEYLYLVFINRKNLKK